MFIERAGYTKYPLAPAGRFLNRSVGFLTCGAACPICLNQDFQDLRQENGRYLAPEGDMFIAGRHALATKAPEGRHVYRRAGYTKYPLAPEGR